MPSPFNLHIDQYDELDHEPSGVFFVVFLVCERETERRDYVRHQWNWWMHCVESRLNMELKAIRNTLYIPHKPIIRKWTVYAIAATLPDRFFSVAKSMIKSKMVVTVVLVRKLDLHQMQSNQSSIQCRCWKALLKKMGGMGGAVDFDFNNLWTLLSFALFVLGKNNNWSVL